MTKIRESHKYRDKDRGKGYDVRVRGEERRKKTKGCYLVVVGKGK